MDKIVFVNQWASHPTKDIMNVFSEKVDDIALIAGYISESGRPLKSKVKISRIIKYNKKSTITRAITWFIATIQIIFLINIKYRKSHLFLTSNPPTSVFIPIFCKNKYSVQILDIYPDALVATKHISEKSWLNRIWVKQNKKFFQGADNVFTITEGMASTISKYCAREKIRVIVQWPMSTAITNIDRGKNEFIRSYNLENYFIVMYSGNIGLGHHVTSIVEVANILRDNSDIAFVIIGEGWNKLAVKKMIQEYKLSNCLLLPFQSPHMFKHSSQAADLGVASVSKELAMLSVPLKVYNLIHNNIPLLGITEGESELSELISRYEIGKCFTPSQLEEISDYIINLKDNKGIILKYKQNLENCSKYYTSENAIRYLDNFGL